jgi:hypothetical protein
MSSGFTRFSPSGIPCLTALIACIACAHADEIGVRKFKVDDSSFKCIQKMTPVRHFFVDNLAGNLEATVAVARAGRGEYPEGTVLQLIPNEVMIKQQKGFSPETKDWEFFYIDVDQNGSKILNRGFRDVNNRLGLNCFECHKEAKPEFDLVCENDHGCAPLPITRAMFGALQRTDPRCSPPQPISPEDAAALKELGPAIEQLAKGAATPK